MKKPMSNKSATEEKKTAPEAAERGPSMAGSEILVKGLEREGVDTIFAYPGGASMEWRGAQLNGKPLRVTRTPELCEALTATGFPSHKRHQNPNIHFYQEFTLRSHGVRRAGSAALDLAYVAAGRLDGFWEFNLNPWDTAAGILLVEEAGGQVTDFSGRHFRLDSREILASNGLIHAELLGFFKEMFAGRNLSPIPTPREFAAHRAAKAAS